MALVLAISKVLSSENLKCVEHHRLTHNRQYAFRRQWSTAALVRYPTHIWNSGVQSYVESFIVHRIVLKLSLGFGSALKKLPSYGVPSTLFNLGYPRFFLLHSACYFLGEAYKFRLIDTQNHKISAVVLWCTPPSKFFLIHINDSLVATNNPIPKFCERQHTRRQSFI